MLHRRLHAKGQNQRLNHFCTNSRFTTQQPNAMYINKIGGEIKFTAEKVLSRKGFAFLCIVLWVLYWQAILST